ncbi:MAG: ribosome small subunit-dependent GTPase A [Bacteroidaceae bacterium]|nr:ribosome small subunit-dependent GTPase A [Bacteroidaceae bacterium]
MIGTIIRNTGSWYTVLTDDGQQFECKVKGTFRLRGIRSTNPVAVGDVVTIVPSADGQTALIEDIEDRRNYIIRKASNLSKQSHIIAANVDMAALVATIAHPETSTTFIDRFLASAEAYRVPVLIIFNKTDLYNEEELRQLDDVMTLYRNIGYTCLACSAVDGNGINELRAELQHKTTLLSGNSGVGKSTLLNLLVPEADAKTAEISAAHDAGMHTTTFSQMFFMPQGGALIDTPGIKGFGTFDMEREEVSHYFREIFRTSDDCRFGNCTHTHEPGCAVLQAVAEGRIAESRYTSYLSMLGDKEEGKYRSPLPAPPLGECFDGGAKR